MTSMTIHLQSDGHIQARTNGSLGIITLNRPHALNALSLPMIADLTCILNAWAADSQVHAVLVLGAGREGKAPAFCAGGDIRFFHQAAIAGDARLDEFFTAEYTLNHLIHHYAKPYIALMDGVVMGGGMGISQGARLRVVNERSKLAMPETNIGLFPDVGAGYFLAQCPGRTGEWLALTGQVLGASDAITLGLADVFVSVADWDDMVRELLHGTQSNAEHIVATVMARSSLAPHEGLLEAHRAKIDRHFSAPSLTAIAHSLGTHDGEWEQATLKAIQQRSPLMLCVTLEQIRRARSMTLAEDLRMERSLVHHCFHARPVDQSETVEGIRALAVDKDHAPRWNPSEIAAVDPKEVARFFTNPWPTGEHPLRFL